MTADAPTASEPGTPVRLAAGTSPQVMLLMFSFPVFVSVAVKVTSKFWLAWLNVLTHCPGVPALPFTMLIDGLVVVVHDALEFVVTGEVVTAEVPLQVIVSVADAVACE